MKVLERTGGLFPDLRGKDRGTDHCGNGNVVLSVGLVGFQEWVEKKLGLAEIHG